MAEFTNLEAYVIEAGEEGEVSEPSNLPPGKRTLGKKAGRKMKAARQKRGQRSERNGWRVQAREIIGGVLPETDEGEWQ